MQVHPFSPTDTPDLSDVVLYAVTKEGSYLDSTNARYLIGRGDVSVNGEVVRCFYETMSPGTYQIQVLERSYHVQVSYARCEG